MLQSTRAVRCALIRRGAGSSRTGVSAAMFLSSRAPLELSRRRFVHSSGRLEKGFLSGVWRSVAETIGVSKSAQNQPQILDEKEGLSRTDLMFKDSPPTELPHTPNGVAKFSTLQGPGLRDRLNELIGVGEEVELWDLHHRLQEDSNPVTPADFGFITYAALLRSLSQTKYLFRELPDGTLAVRRRKSTPLQRIKFTSCRDRIISALPPDGADLPLEMFLAQLKARQNWIPDHIALGFTNVDELIQCMEPWVKLKNGRVRLQHAASAEKRKALAQRVARLLPPNGSAMSLADLKDAFIKKYGDFWPHQYGYPCWPPLLSSIGPPVRYDKRGQRRMLRLHGAPPKQPSATTGASLARNNRKSTADAIPGPSPLRPTSTWVEEDKTDYNAGKTAEEIAAWSDRGISAEGLGSIEETASASPLEIEDPWTAMAKLSKEAEALSSKGTQGTPLDEAQEIKLISARFELLQQALLAETELEERKESKSITPEEESLLTEKIREAVAWANEEMVESEESRSQERARKIQKRREKEKKRKAKWEKRAMEAEAAAAAAEASTAPVQAAVSEGGKPEPKTEPAQQQAESQKPQKSKQKSKPKSKKQPQQQQKDDKHIDLTDKANPVSEALNKLQGSMVGCLPVDGGWVDEATFMDKYREKNGMILLPAAYGHDNLPDLIRELPAVQMSARTRRMALTRPLMELLHECWPGDSAEGVQISEFKTIFKRTHGFPLRLKDWGMTKTEFMQSVKTLSTDGGKVHAASSNDNGDAATAAAAASSTQDSIAPEPTVSKSALKNRRKKARRKKRKREERERLLQEQQLKAKEQQGNKTGEELLATAGPETSSEGEQSKQDAN